MNFITPSDARWLFMRDKLGTLSHLPDAQRREILCSAFLRLMSPVHFASYQIHTFPNPPILFN